MPKCRKCDTDLSNSNSNGYLHLTIYATRMNFCNQCQNNLLEFFHTLLPSLEGKEYYLYNDELVTYADIKDGDLLRGCWNNNDICEVLETRNCYEINPDQERQNMVDLCIKDIITGDVIGWRGYEWDTSSIKRLIK